MKGLGIKYQLRVTTLIPVFLVALLFAFFYNAQFGKDLEQHISRLGEAYIRQLIPAAQFAMLRNDNRTLQGLINASTVNPEIKSLAFYNATGQLLAYRGGKHSLKTPFKPPPFTGDYIESKQVDPFTINFLAPITIPKFNLYSPPPFKSAPTPIDFQTDDIIGWLSIYVDTQPLLIKRYQMIVVTIFITLFGLLLGLTIHYFLSKRIYAPIARLRRSMKQILSNEFETRIKISSTGELGVIEQGCSHLQKQYLSTIRELNHHIEVATEDLQQSLELLEEKNIELSLEKRKTEEKSRQKSEFIANMSHEIRTPMNGVLGFTNVLLESNLDPLQLDYVKTIKASAQDLLTVINDILDYSKIDAGKLHLDCIPFDIRHCIDEVLVLAAPNAHKKGVDLIPITEIDVPTTVLGDPLRIKQIISNLVNNAIKFTDHGHVLIRTKIEQESDKKYTLSLSIIDTGRGISSEDQAKLFQAFHQADTSITRRYGGSGLGLVICQKLAEQMQGRVHLNSELHKGSIVTVTITVEKISAYEIEKKQTHRFAHLKVLCFDENPLHLEALCNGLQFWGIECIPINAFNKMPEALVKYQDAILTLINVNQSCEEQIHGLLKNHQGMPCILISKWPIHDHNALNAQGFLFKPISIQKLHDIIAAILNQRQLQEPDNANLALDHLRAELKSLRPHILLAEDNPVNRLLLNSLLSDYTSITAVEDGEIAVQSANKEKFDIILLDLQMPKMNGIDAAACIHQASLLNKKTPIILISASSNTCNNQELMPVGITLWLQKPIDEKELLTHLLKLLKRSSSNAIHWELCLQRASGKKDLARAFLNEFIEELKINRSELIGFVQKNDLTALENLAHKLHGACCYCGVPDLQKKVIHVEQLAKQRKNSYELEEALTELIKSIDAVLDDYLLCRDEY